MEHWVGAIGRRVYDEALADGTVSKSDHQLTQIFTNLAMSRVEGIEGEVKVLHIDASQCLFTDAGFFAFLEVLRRLVFALRDELAASTNRIVEGGSNGAQLSTNPESANALSPQRPIAVRIGLRNANLDNGRVLSLANAVDSVFPLHKFIVVDTIDVSENIQVSTVGGKRLRRLRREYPFLRNVYARDCALNAALQSQIEESAGGNGWDMSMSGTTRTLDSAPAEQQQERPYTGSVEVKVSLPSDGLDANGEVADSPEAAPNARVVLGVADDSCAPSGGTPPTQPREGRRDLDDSDGTGAAVARAVELRLPSPPQVAKPECSVVRRVFAAEPLLAANETIVSEKDATDVARFSSREATHTDDTTVTRGSATLPYASSSDLLKNPDDAHSAPSSPKLYYVWNAGSNHKHRGSEDEPPPPPTSPQEPLPLLRRLYESTAQRRGQFWWTSLHHHEVRVSARTEDQGSRMDRLMAYLSTSKYHV